MASFGHVAAGFLAARLHGEGHQRGQVEPGGGGSGPRPVSWWTLLLFSGLALLPDADVLLVALGACDTGVCGHRGFSHSFPFAIAIGIVGGLLARRLRLPAIRTGIATALAVGSHAALDLLGEGGRGLPLLWPFSEHRFTSPIRIFPDAPRGWALLSRPGIVNVATELVVFCPLVFYALWPRIAAWLSTRTAARRIPKLPNLTFVEGASGLEDVAGLEAAGLQGPSVLESVAGLEAVAGVEAAAGLAPTPAPAPATTGEGDPSIRSAG